MDEADKDRRDATARRRRITALAGWVVLVTVAVSVAWVAAGGVTVAMPAAISSTRTGTSSVPQANGPTSTIPRHGGSPGTTLPPSLSSPGTVPTTEPGEHSTSPGPVTQVTSRPRVTVENEPSDDHHEHDTTTTSTTTSTTTTTTEPGASPTKAP